VALFDTNGISQIINNDQSLKYNYENFVNEWKGTVEFKKMVDYLKNT